MLSSSWYNRSEAEAGSGQVVDIAFSRVLSGSEGAVNGGYSTSLYYNNDLLETGFQNGRREDGILERDGGKNNPPLLLRRMDTKCSFGADGTANGCSSSRGFGNTNNHLHWVRIDGDLSDKLFARGVGCVGWYRGGCFIDGRVVCTAIVRNKQPETTNKYV